MTTTTEAPEKAAEEKPFQPETIVKTSYAVDFRDIDVAHAITRVDDYLFDNDFPEGYEIRLHGYPVKGGFQIALYAEPKPDNPEDNWG
jgi:hypothetical protein